MIEQTASTVVRTRGGAVRGVFADGVAAFRGIPFAAPPVGALRFQAPRPPEPWEGVREADVFGPPPPQAPLTPPPPVPGPAGPIRHDPSDWLTLNVWTPDAGAAGLPVLVWIHGGAYRMGSSADPGYDGSVLAKTGAVVVTANHRVGVEGYAQLDGAPANRALLDIAAVLRWVQEEITAFGGDPAQVTVFGESAGAGAIVALMVMPAGEGLFARAIAQSVPGTFFTPALARDVSAEIVAPLGLAPTTAALADVPPERLVGALNELDRRMPTIDRWGLVAHTPTPFSPVVDGEVLPVNPWAGLAAGASRDVPLIVGHNRDEWRLFLVMGGESVSEEMAAGAMRAFGPGPDAEERIRAANPGATAEELFVLTCSDRMFRMPSVHIAEAHTAGGGRSHLYELTWPTPTFGGLFGACHFLDVPLVFGVFDSGLPLQLLGSPPPPEADEVSAQMQGAWTAFAGGGDPGWAPYGEQQLTRVFDAGGRGGVRPYPEEASWKLWADASPEVLDLR
jgi:para-nitrobenzyl esterase